jgi:two-component system sensor histidine kinase CiaH
MFKKARIKLTLMYLAIIMTISLCFSVFIYRMVSFEIQQRLFAIERRLDLRQWGFYPPPGQDRLFIEDLKEAESKVLVVLVYTNIVILFFSSVAGYFLAGITLKPIENVMDEQKRFVADASHELKTPLTALQTSIEVALRDKKIDLKEALFTLSDSLSDVKKLTVLTTDLLSLTKYQQNGVKEYFEKVNLNNILSESVKKIAPMVKQKNILLSIEGSDAFVNGNKEGLEKLVTILLDNAVKYTPGKGKVSVEYRTKGKNVVIVVKDSGVGIEKKDLPLIFERFYRSDVSRSKIRADGFGLGLSIAKSIVDIHHGTIEVESEFGKGSTFTVKLPVE